MYVYQRVDGYSPWTTMVILFGYELLNMGCFKPTWGVKPAKDRLQLGVIIHQSDHHRELFVTCILMILDYTTSWLVFVSSILFEMIITTDFWGFQGDLNHQPASHEVLIHVGFDNNMSYPKNGLELITSPYFPHFKGTDSQCIFGILVRRLPPSRRLRFWLWLAHQVWGRFSMKMMILDDLMGQLILILV